MPLWPILGVSLFAFAMAMFFAVSGIFSPEAVRAAVPASLALSAIGMLGGMVLGVLRNHEDRLRRLEKETRESAAAADAARS